MFEEPQAPNLGRQDIPEIESTPTGQRSGIRGLIPGAASPCPLDKNPLHFSCSDQSLRRFGDAEAGCNRGWY
jgi:hypothetical protein